MDELKNKNSPKNTKSEKNRKRFFRIFCWAVEAIGRIGDPWKKLKRPTAFE